MGTTAEKLTYLNNTKQLLKENINSLGGNLTTEPFRQYASVLEGIYERIPKVSGIGTSLSLSPTMVGKIKLNEIQGDTLQNGTPTPSSPVPIQNVTGLQNVNVTGDNLFNPNWFTYRTTNGITATLEDGHILLNGTATASAYINFTIPSNIFNDSYSWYVKSDETLNYGLKILRSSGGNVDISPTTNWTTSRFSSTNVTGGYIYVANGTTLNNCKVYIDVRKDNIGLNDFIYEPYKRNTYEVNLGKNLFDINNANWILFNSSYPATYDSENNGWYNKHYMDLEFTPITTQTFSFDIKKRELESGEFNYSGKWFIRKDGTIVKYDTGGNSDTYVRNTYTMEAGHTYLFRVYNHCFINDIQLEKSSQVTSYSPYFTPIELNGIPNTTYEDCIFKNEPKNPLYDSSLTLNSWYLKKNIGKVVLDGSEGWGLASTYTNNTRFSSSSLILGKTTPLISNYFLEGQSGTDTTNIDTNGGTGSLMITIPKSIASTISEFTTWLSSNKPEILYQLATPEYTEITNEELIEDLETLYTAKSQEGTTNISITSENLPMIINASALKGED